jgi:hypothetical protein
MLRRRQCPRRAGRCRAQARLGEQADTIRLREIVVTAGPVPVPMAEAPGTVTVLAGHGPA